MIYTEEQVFMNTIIRVQVICKNGARYTKKRTRDAYGHFSHVVEKFSRFSDKSELSKLNLHSGQKFTVSKELFNLINYSLELADISSGAFDPTVIDLLEKYGYDKKGDLSRSEEPEFFTGIKKLLKNRPSYKDIELDEHNLTVKLVKDQKIDLGSLGKGYAIDLAFDELKKEFEHFLINAGGDIRVNGLNEHGLYWKVILYKAPLPNQLVDGDNVLGIIEVEPGLSIAGSGGWARRVGVFHHLLSTKNGLPINNISQSYVLAPTALMADAWATLLFVKGRSALPRLISRNMAGLLMDFRGNISQTENFNYSVL